MEMFKSIINNWSIHQILSLSAMFFFSFVFITFSIWFLSGKKKEFVKISILSLLSSGSLIFLSFIFLNSILKLEISYIFLLTPVIVLIIEVISLGMILGFFTSQKMNKEMDVLSLEKETFKDSVQISIFIILLVLAFIPSLTGIFLIFVLTTFILSIATIWINFFLVNVIFKNE